MVGFETSDARQGSVISITGDELRKNDDHLLIDVLIGHIPGIKAFATSKQNSAEYVASTRKCGAGPVFLNCKAGQATFCPVTMYIDGVLTYTASGTVADAPDMRQFDIRQYEAVEFYAGGATTPARYNATSSGCGVLLASRTRERWTNFSSPGCKILRQPQRHVWNPFRLGTRITLHASECRRASSVSYEHFIRTGP